MPECLCGCGARPASRFMPGHLARTNGYGVDPRAELNDIMDQRSIAYRTGITHARWGLDAISDDPDYLYGYEKEKAYV